MANCYSPRKNQRLISLAAYRSLPTLFPYMNWAAGTVTSNRCQVHGGLNQHTQAGKHRALTLLEVKSSSGCHP